MSAGLLVWTGFPGGSPWARPPSARPADHSTLGCSFLVSKMRIKRDDCTY